MLVKNIWIYRCRRPDPSGGPLFITRIVGRSYFFDASPQVKSRWNEAVGPAVEYARHLLSSPRTQRISEDQFLLETGVDYLASAGKWLGLHREPQLLPIG